MKLTVPPQGHRSIIETPVRAAGPQLIGKPFDGHDMMVDPKDIVVLTDFPLRWRWTHETHAKFSPDDLASIRPIRPDRAASICGQIGRGPLVPSRPEDRLLVVDETDRQVASKWLEDRVPEEESELILVWDRRTAALVGRRLFIDRWDDFWYPSSDDLGVLGTVGCWRIEMYHYGTFDFSERGAVKPLLTDDPAAETP